jgi:hypothetical protein
LHNLEHHEKMGLRCEPNSAFPKQDVTMNLRTMSAQLSAHASTVELAAVTHGDPQLNAAAEHMSACVDKLEQVSTFLDKLKGSIDKEVPTGGA